MGSSYFRHCKGKGASLRRDTKFKTCMTSVPGEDFPLEGTNTGSLKEVLSAGKREMFTQPDHSEHRIEQQQVRLEWRSGLCTCSTLSPRLKNVNFSLCSIEEFQKV